jgi:hypothetical protein
LKRKVGGNAFNEEYRVVMNDIKGALNLPKKQKNKPREELPEVESDHQDAKVVNIELQRRTDPYEVLSFVLPFLNPKDILQASALCHKSMALVDHFVNDNNTHVKSLFQITGDNQLTSLFAVLKAYKS